MRVCRVYDFTNHFVDYLHAWQYQRALQEVILCARKSGNQSTDHLLLLQHPSVYTLGRGADTSNIKFNSSNSNKTVYKIERGGDVTWHGPGQLVAYPILDLHNHKKDLHWYVLFYMDISSLYDARFLLSIGT
ncbi:hypothetical protein EON65_34185 [archaeon]|nr:MAG: hypothetical protein EON65_34185 [archaeon]